MHAVGLPLTWACPCARVEVVAAVAEGRGGRQHLEDLELENCSRDRRRGRCSWLRSSVWSKRHQSQKQTTHPFVLLITGAGFGAGSPSFECSSGDQHAQGPPVRSRRVARAVLDHAIRVMIITINCVISYDIISYDIT